MADEKALKEIVERIQALEEQMAALAHLIPDTNETEEGKEKRCLPGYNTCDI